MTDQKPNIRIKNFKEVCYGYTENMAIKEAKKCIQCVRPLCVSGCPVSVDIPKFVYYISIKNYNKALEIIKQTNNFPGVCGRVCPQEKQCESKCILGIKKTSVSIGKLERFASDFGTIQRTKYKHNGKKVAIIGSGPAGLSCATDLNRFGYDVTIFEAFHKAGGVLSYGIPEFRLPKKIVEEEIKAIIYEGVSLKVNYVIGKIFNLKELQNNFQAIFIANGAGLPYFMGIPGEDNINVYSANEFLTRINLMKAYDSYTPILKADKTVVIGCGNVAVDAARCAKRLGSDVKIVYRRTIEEALARVEEIQHAKEEKIKFEFLTFPIRILGDKYVEGIEVVKMKMGKLDETGRKKPIPIKNSKYIIKCDQVIFAIGQGPNPILTQETNLHMNQNGKLIVNDKLKTNLSSVFAGGDIIEGDTTVIKAMGDGKKAAIYIDNFLYHKKLK